MRSDLRLSDLEGRGTVAAKLMNVKVPAHVAEGIARVADELGATKTAAVIALLNEGLDAFEARRDEFPKAPAKVRGPRRGRPAQAAREAAVG